MNLEVPYPELSDQWFYKRGRLALTNKKRNEIRKTKETVNEEYCSLTKYPENDSFASCGDAIASLQRKVTSEKRKQKSVAGCIAVLREMQNTCPVMAVQDLVKIYQKESAEHVGDEVSQCRMVSSVMQERFLQHDINLSVVYIRGKAFCMFGAAKSVLGIAKQLEGMLPKDIIVNEVLEEKLGEIFASALKMMDTKQDKDILKSLFATATSAKFTAKLQGVTNLSSISNCKNQLQYNIKRFEDLRLTTIPVRNDMTNRQQRMLWQRLITKRKRTMAGIVNENRGRKLKVEQFPELTSILESFFDDAGMAAHPRLTTTTLFRPEQNNLFMCQAREKILLHAPENFALSLSTCYNYTQNYRENSRAAKQHHHGKGINADISLKRPPRANTKAVINVHWAAASVNLYISDSCNDINTVIDSKDAKTIVIGDNTPVQKPGKSWKPINAPDHDWDQSRTFALTPMTHLIMETKIHDKTTEQMGTQTMQTTTITRTGKACSFINLSFFETDSTFRRFNEIFLLMSLPLLDNYFRNTDTGKLKSSMGFLVDNGPGECPGSFMVRMLLVRLLKYFDLDKVVQKSFAEYHSKMNFVERVHATENDLLSRHGPFNSKQAHKEFQIGDEKHHENMEVMAKEMISCLSQGKYAGKPLTSNRGIMDDQYVFSDEDTLRKFSLLSEELKQACEWTYSTQNVPLHQEMKQLWKASDMERKYVDDYNILTQINEPNTNWTDKYTCALYRDDEKWKVKQRRYELQPLPDYVRWQDTSELHYLSRFKTLQLLSDDVLWTNVSQLFLPTKLLNTFLRLTLEIPEEVLPLIALLCWLPIDDVKTYIQEKVAREKKLTEESIEFETYKSHKLFKKRKAELIEICKAKKLVFRLKKKHELVKLLASEETIPTYVPKSLEDVPSSLGALSKISIADCRSILTSNHLSTIGSKDEMVLRIYLLKSRKEDFIFKTEVKEIKNLISVAKSIISEEQRLRLIGVTDELERRKYSSQINCKAKIILPEVEELETIFKPVELFVSSLCSVELRTSDAKEPLQAVSHDPKEIDSYNVYFNVGTKVKIFWERKDVAHLGWRGGWYVAHVTDFCHDEDRITVSYVSEPDSIYDIEVAVSLEEGILALC